MDSSRPRILCVDDEQAVLDGLKLRLKRRYEVETATSGALGLEIMREKKDLVVVISDMRMPQMDGAAFLTQAHALAPDVTRILLTGQTDLDSAITAVNDGQIFRFLTKPCSPERLSKALEAAVEHNRLVTSERVLFEQTLNGSIKTLADILAQAHPQVFGRVTRIKTYALELSKELALGETWQLEIAALFSQLGYVTLPQETLDQLAKRETLADDEREMVERLPAFTDQLLGNIPRLENVRAILAEFFKLEKNVLRNADEKLLTKARILRIAVDFNVLDEDGYETSVAVDALRSQPEKYDAKLLEIFGELRGSAKQRQEIRELPLRAIQAGMIFAEDVKASNGMLIAARGYEVTASFVARLQNFRPGTIRDRVRVIIRMG